MAIYIPQINSLKKDRNFSQGSLKYIHQLESCIVASIEEAKRNFVEDNVAADLPPGVVAREVLRVITSSDFNYQARGRIAHLKPDLLAAFEAAAISRKKLPIFLLLHGGYRAMVGGDSLGHVFAPDITEVLLIYQISRLRRRISTIYSPGIHFSIVVNNGVAAFTNGIPYDKTNGYVACLRGLIEKLGAQDTVWVLNQSELGDFEQRMAGIEITPKREISEVGHRIVERFVGRACSVEEACLRAATYEQAERAWEQEIRAIVASQSGIFCRQVAHPACLSFRPFPGAAIRIQNGTVGFRIGSKGLVPSLVTPATWNRDEASFVPIHLPLFDEVHKAGVGHEFPA